MSDYRSRFRDFGLSYKSAMHGMQTGVEFERQGYKDQGLNPDTNGPTNHKHLRVGVNSALIEGSAICLLLIEKGIITEEELSEALRLAANEEVAKYEDRLPANLQSKIKFR